MQLRSRVKDLENELSKPSDERVRLLQKRLSELEASGVSSETLSTQRKLLKQDLSLNAVRAQLKQALSDLEAAEKRCEVLTTVSGTISPRTFRKPGRSSSAKASAGIVLSDWHVGEVVDPSTVNNLNEFDLAVATKRIRRTYEKTLFFLDAYRKIAPIEELVVAIIGDLITGYIHEELVENAECSPTEAILFLQEQITGGIDFFLREGGVKRIRIPTAYGNHGRTTPKKRIATGYKNSYEWLLYKTLERLYRHDPRVQFQVENGIHTWVEVQGHPVRVQHGDAIQFGGGVGGITIPVNKAISQWNKSRKAKLDLFGHFHQYLSYWSWICNGSLIGYNNYALEIKAEYQSPSQTFFVVDKEYGLVESKPIFC